MAQVLSVFQSPLHRGILFNDVELAHIESKGMNFQSPLHRGILFNGTPSQYRGINFVLSVPSSSGNTLQRKRVARIITLQSAFSPLFIGEYSSTQPCGGLHESSVHFQSPLHRGILFNNWTDTGGTYLCSFQSPLHRGILFNRPSPCSAPLSAECLSVPSSSGNTLQRSGQQH